MFKQNNIIKLNSLNNFNINLKSIITKKLTKNEIRVICLLKDEEWTYGIRSQLDWFKNNIQSCDKHNLLFINSKLVGYTVLRRKVYSFKNFKKKNFYLLLDTLIVDKKYRKLKLSELLMFMNNLTIKKTGMISFLLCNNKLVKFYKMYGWKKINRKFVGVINSKFHFNGMVFNEKK
jgi:predicted GNAT family N-acyltransferase